MIWITLQVTAFLFRHLTPELFSDFTNLLNSRILWEWLTSRFSKLFIVTAISSNYNREIRTIGYQLWTGNIMFFREVELCQFLCRMTIFLDFKNSRHSMTFYDFWTSIFIFHHLPWLFSIFLSAWLFMKMLFGKCFRHKTY